MGNGNNFKQTTWGDSVKERLMKKTLIKPRRKDVSLEDVKKATTMNNEPTNVLMGDPQSL